MENRFFYLISKTENAINVYTKQQLVKAGLKVTPGQLGILFLLKNRDKQTMSELSTALDTDNSAITRSIDRLEKSGLVNRNFNMSDRREIIISVTDSGISETENARVVIDKINLKIQKEFKPAELEIFKSCMIRMTSLFRNNEM